MKSLLKLKDDLRADTMCLFFLRGFVEITATRYDKVIIEQAVRISEEELRGYKGDINDVIRDKLSKFKEAIHDDKRH